jgi:hypothetical protein
LFKRILLTAVLGAGLLLTVPNAAEADHKRDRDRKDHWGIRAPGYYGGYGPIGYGSGGYGPGGYAPGGGYLRGGVTPFWHFRGFDKHPDLYWYPAGYGAGARYNQGYVADPVFNDVFSDSYFAAYGYRCNGYRDGYYYGADGAPFVSAGRPFYRRNADCESYFRRHGSWYGTSDCSRFEVEKGYCEDYDRHGHRKFW